MTSQNAPKYHQKFIRIFTADTRENRVRPDKRRIPGPTLPMTDQRNHFVSEIKRDFSGAYLTKNIILFFAAPRV